MKTNSPAQFPNAEPTLTPAWGKDYKSKKAVLEAFDAGVEFKAMSINPPMSGYTTKSELVKLGIKRVTFRYKRRAECLPHKF